MTEVLAIAITFIAVFALGFSVGVIGTYYAWYLPLTKKAKAAHQTAKVTVDLMSALLKSAVDRNGKDGPIVSPIQFKVKNDE